METHSKKRRQASESGGHERWLVSYADFITLLFAFFVVMYAIAMDDKAKAQKIAQAVREALASTSEGSTQAPPVPQPKVEHQTKEQSMAAAIVKELARTEELLKESFTADPVPHFAPGDIEIAQDHRGVVVRISATAFFKPNEAVVRSQATLVLDRIAGLLKKSTRDIRVEGHTGTDPVQSTEYASNWELSAARAVWVVRYLASKHGINPHRLSAAGFGGYRPLGADSMDEGRSIPFAYNHRIEVVVLSGSE